LLHFIDSCFEGLLKSVRRWHLADRSRRKHKYAHLVLDAVHAIWLDDNVHLIEAARGHPNVVEKDLHVVHAWFELKVMLTPGPQIELAINHNSRSAGIKKE